jgi:hypothetical protein
MVALLQIARVSGGLHLSFSVAHRSHSGGRYGMTWKTYIAVTVMSCVSVSRCEDRRRSLSPHVSRAAPNEVSVVNPEAILQIHGARSWIRGKSYSSNVHSKQGAKDRDASLLNLRDRGWPLFQPVSRVGCLCLTRNMQILRMLPVADSGTELSRWSLCVTTSL